jgi:hypothetical protein
MARGGEIGLGQEQMWPKNSLHLFFFVRAFFQIAVLKHLIQNKILAS